MPGPVLTRGAHISITRCKTQALKPWQLCWQIHVQMDTGLICDQSPAVQGNTFELAKLKEGRRQKIDHGQLLQSRKLRRTNACTAWAPDVIIQ